MDWTGRTSLLVLPSGRGRKGKHTVDDCVIYRDDWNGLQRHEQRVFVWIAGAQNEDPWEYNIAPRKGPVPQAVRGVHAVFARVELLASDPQPEFPNTVDSL